MPSRWVCYPAPNTVKTVRLLCHPWASNFSLFLPFPSMSLSLVLSITTKGSTYFYSLWTTDSAIFFSYTLPIISCCPCGDVLMSCLAFWVISMLSFQLTSNRFESICVSIKHLCWQLAMFCTAHLQQSCERIYALQEGPSVVGSSLGNFTLLGQPRGCVYTLPPRGPGCPQCDTFPGGQMLMISLLCIYIPHSILGHQDLSSRLLISESASEESELW